MKIHLKSSAKISGVNIGMISKNDLPKDGGTKPMLVVYSGPAFIEQVEQIPNISKTMVIPWIILEIENWAEEKDAKDYVEVIRGEEYLKNTPLEPIVIAALSDIVKKTEELRTNKY